MTQIIAGVEVFETDGLERLLPGLSFMTPVALATASTPDRARTIPTKPLQFSARLFERGCRLWIAWPKCGTQNAARRATVATVGTAIKKARPPVCLGPK